MESCSSGSLINFLRAKKHITSTLDKTSNQDVPMELFLNINDLHKLEKKLLVEWNTSLVKIMSIILDSLGLV